MRIHAQFTWSQNRQAIRISNQFVVDGKAGPYVDGLYAWDPQQHVIAVPEPDETEAHNWATFEIERSLPLRVDQLQQGVFLIIRRRRSKIETLEIQLRRRLHDLSRLVVDERVRGPQNFVPLDYGKQALLQ